jgi:lysophospholipase L1-like esterase
MAIETRQTPAPADDTRRQEHQPVPVDAPPKGRRGMAAGRVFVVMIVSLLGWGVLYAPELQRTSEAQPEGLRRTVSLALLNPVVWISDRVFLSTATDQAARMLGRDPDAAIGGGEIPIEVDDLPSFTPPVDRPGGSPSTGKDKLRIAVVGDSLAGGIGYYAERVFKPFFSDVVKRGQISTGLARADYFNWPGEMKYIVDRFRPDLTIVMLGENDDQSLLTPDGTNEATIGTAQWPGAYEDRVERFARIATSEGGHVVWVGLPVPRDEESWPFIRRLNDIYAAVAERLPNVAFYDSWEEFAKPDGSYTAYYRDGNDVKLIRADDGIHFNGDGYTIVMENVARFITDAFDLDPKTYET